MTRTARRTALGSTTAIGMSFVVFLWSPGAMANGCDTTTPSIGQTIVCDAAGTETITVPTGANAVEVVVIGGGGGGASSSSGPDGGAGGAGAQVTASFSLGAGESIEVKVGDGGEAGSRGGGGGYSSITNGDLLLVVAGGGGGGGPSSGSQGGAGGDGAADGNAAGGDGTNADGSATNGGGGGNVDSTGAGGAGGIGVAGTGGAGDSWAEGGAGGVGYGGSSGSGGSGYGGGGGGGGHAGNNKSRPGGGAGGSYANPDYSVGSPVYVKASGAAGKGGDGGKAGAPIVDTEDGAAGSVTITFIIIPTASTGSSAATPRAISLDFTLPTGIECRFDSVEASLGSWIELPSASDCTISPRATDTQPTLLGWATNADFPIDIAQRQVDNGWGAYETFSDDGELTGVFIPAAGYTLLSNDTNLHPIWSD